MMSYLMPFPSFPVWASTTPRMFPLGVGVNCWSAGNVALNDAPCGLSSIAVAFPNACKLLDTTAMELSSAR